MINSPFETIVSPFLFLLTIQTDFSVVYITTFVELNTLRVHYTWRRDHMSTPILLTPVGEPSHIPPSNPYDTMTAAAALSFLPAEGARFEPERRYLET